jgi:hypothetical protein
VAGDEDDGQGGSAFNQAVLQLQAGHAAHADVHDQAGDFARVVTAQKGFGRIETADPVVLAFQQPLQRIAHGFVVIDDIDGAFFGESSSCSFLESLMRLAACGSVAVPALRGQIHRYPEGKRQPVTSAPL